MPGRSLTPSRRILAVLLGVLPLVAGASGSGTLFFSREAKADVGQMARVAEFKAGDPIIGMLVQTNNDFADLKPWTYQEGANRYAKVQLAWGEAGAGKPEGRTSFEVPLSAERLARRTFAFFLVHPGMLPRDPGQRIFFRILGRYPGKKLKVTVTIAGEGNMPNMEEEASLVVDLGGGFGGYAEGVALQAKADQEAKASAAKASADEAAASKKAAADDKAAEIAASAKVPIPTPQMRDPVLDRDALGLFQKYFGPKKKVTHAIIRADDWRYKKNALGVLLARQMDYWVGLRDLESGDCVLTRKYFLEQEHITGGQFAKPVVGWWNTAGKHEWAQPCDKLEKR